MSIYVSFWYFSDVYHDALSVTLALLHTLLIYKYTKICTKTSALRTPLLDYANRIAQLRPLCHCRLQFWRIHLHRLQMLRAALHRRTLFLQHILSTNHKRHSLHCCTDGRLNCAKKSLCIVCVAALEVHESSSKCHINRLKDV